jgi:hypothetical protein
MFVRQGMPGCGLEGIPKRLLRFSHVYYTFINMALRAVDGMMLLRFGGLSGGEFNWQRARAKHGKFRMETLSAQSRLPVAGRRASGRPFPRSRVLTGEEAGKVLLHMLLQYMHLPRHARAQPVPI